jgi:hypothetical protein
MTEGDPLSDVGLEPENPDTLERDGVARAGLDPDPDAIVPRG